MSKKGSREQRESEKRVLAMGTEQGRAPCPAPVAVSSLTGLCCGDRHPGVPGSGAVTFGSG